LKIFSKTILAVILISVSSVSASSKYNAKTITSVDSTKIYFEYAGEGELAIVFIHGWSCDVSFWEKQMEYFRKNHKVVAIDLAGHGYSGLQRKDYTMQAYGQDVKAVVEDQNLDKIVLVGHSMGGAVITEAASLLGERVIGLVGADTFRNFTRIRTPEEIDSFLSPFKENFDEKCNQFVKTIFGLNSDTLLVNKITMNMCDANVDVAISSMENLLNYEFTNMLKQLNKPIVAINSLKFPTTVEANKEIYKLFNVKFMKGVGHFVMNEDPDTFNKLLKETINELKNQ